MIIVDLAVHDLDVASHRQLKYYNRRRWDIRYEVGDIVWRRTHILSSAKDYVAKKLSPKYAGPYRVTNVSTVVYKIQDELEIIEKAHIKEI